MCCRSLLLILALGAALPMAAEARLLIRLDAVAIPAIDAPDPVQRRARIIERLQAAARTAQAPVIRLLEARGIAYRSFWIANVVVADAEPALRERLMALPGVVAVVDEPRFRVPGAIATAPAKGMVDGNLAQIRVPDVWALGVRGAGAVVGGADTGFDWTHPAVIGAYRGRADDGSVNHDHNWHDAIHSGPIACGPDASEPCDAGNHGTLTLGVMVGEDGPDRPGVAPDARWIGCRNMNSATGTLSSFLECFQWFLAPTDGDDRNPDPGLAPHVINNSWGCIPAEGCTDPTVLAEAVVNTRNAGIVVVGAAGNGGPGCGTVTDPPAIYAGTIAVGAVTDGGEIAEFSSRGPVIVDGSGRIKPDLSAPGVDIRSTLPGGGYAAVSGTSFAGPHVAGVVALMISVNPRLAGDVPRIEEILLSTARPRPAATPCSSTATSDRNNSYGFGLIDALAAVVDADTLLRVSFE